MLKKQENPLWSKDEWSSKSSQIKDFSKGCTTWQGLSNQSVASDARANCPKMLPFFRRSENVQMQRGLRDERHHTSCRHGNQGKSVDIWWYLNQGIFVRSMFAIKHRAYTELHVHGQIEMTRHSSEGVIRTQSCLRHCKVCECHSIFWMLLEGST